MRSAWATDERQRKMVYSKQEDGGRPDVLSRGQVMHVPGCVDA